MALRPSRTLGLVLWIIAFAWAVPGWGADYYAAPDGQPKADGSRERPWDLQTALFGNPDKDGKPQVVAGDTVWLRGGTYVGGFDCRLEGTEQAPVVIRPEPGQRVTIDCRSRDERDSGLFTILGPHNIVRDIEFTCSELKRTTELKGPWPDDIRRGGVFCRGDHAKLINLDIHDLASGLGFWATGIGGEVYGCLFHHNGWKAPDRAHGHGIYAQNEKGTKSLVDNVLFCQFSHGIHCYGSKKAKLENLHVEGNACFLNGCFDPKAGPAPGLFVGGEMAVANVNINRNYLYGNGLNVGYPWGQMNRDVTITDNEIAGGLFLRDFRQIVFKRNSLIAPGMLLQFQLSEPVSLAASQWDDNRYVRTTNEYQAFGKLDGTKSRGLSFAEWRADTGFDAASDYREGAPTGTKVIVRPNRYEPGRAHVIVYNWDQAATVPVELGNLLQPGQKYRVQSVRNLYGPPVLTGTYDGKPLALPMRPTPVVPAVGMPADSEPQVEPTFGVFVVLPDKT